MIEETKVLPPGEGYEDCEYGGRHWRSGLHWIKRPDERAGAERPFYGCNPYCAQAVRPWPMSDFTGIPADSECSLANCTMQCKGFTGPDCVTFTNDTARYVIYLDQLKNMTLLNFQKLMNEACEGMDYLEWKRHDFDYDVQCRSLEAIQRRLQGWNRQAQEETADAAERLKATPKNRDSKTRLSAAKRWEEHTSKMLDAWKRAKDRYNVTVNT